MVDQAPAQGHHALKHLPAIEPGGWPKIKNRPRKQVAWAISPATTGCGSVAGLFADAGRGIGSESGRTASISIRISMELYTAQSVHGALRNPAAHGLPDAATHQARSLSWAF